jgi:hypothetical protein
MEARAPGAQIREVELAPPAFLQLGVAGFVGQAERGPLHSPQLLASWGQFTDIFGGFTGFSYLSYAVFGFFANGGRRCRVVRTAHWRSQAARLDLGAVRVHALDPGVWGNAVEVDCRAATGRLAPDGFRLTFRYRPGGRTVREEVFDDLSPHPEHERYFARLVNGDPPAESYVEKARQGCSTLVRLEDAGGKPPEAVTGKLLTGGEDGPQRLTLAHYTGYEDGVLFHPQSVPEGTLGGLAAFEQISEIGTVAIPDLILPELIDALGDRAPAQGVVFAGAPPGGDLPLMLEGQREMLRHCRRMGERFALLDAPRGAEPGSWADEISKLPEAREGALYYPWLRHRAADFGGRDLLIPPCGHVAGIYARSEERRGVGKAPANEILQGVVSLEVCLDDGRQALLNPLGVNCLRALPGRGLRVWGARTLSRDPLWRYVNVRRVALAIVKQILTRLRWTVFEPNGPGLWRAVTSTLTLFLLQLLERGALAGASAQEAFFVQCDEETNPPELAGQGQMVARIGFAPARPAEFVVVTLRRTAESLAVTEQGL